MRILVTGSAGFIGSHLAEQLLADGHEVVGLDAFTDYYPRPVKELNLQALRKDGSFRFHEIDLRTDDLTEAFRGCDGVIHTAAMPGLPRSWTDFEGYSSCNLLATQRVAQACLEAEVGRLVHVSTSSVYGLDAVGDEAMPTSPTSPYGVTKLAAEHLLMAYHRTLGLPVTVLRYFSIYGPRQRPDMAYHIFIEAIMAGRPITILGDGSQSRSSTYVKDCVRGTIQALHDAPVGEVFNIGGGQVVSLLDAVALIGEVVGREPKLEFRPGRPGDQRHTAADTSKAHRVFGFHPEVLPREGLAAQVAWHRSRESAA